MIPACRSSDKCAGNLYYCDLSPVSIAIFPLSRYAWSETEKLAMIPACRSSDKCAGISKARVLHYISYPRANHAACGSARAARQPATPARDFGSEEVRTTNAHKFAVQAPAAAAGRLKARVLVVTFAGFHRSLPPWCCIANLCPPTCVHPRKPYRVQGVCAGAVWRPRAEITFGC